MSPIKQQEIRNKEVKTQKELAKSQKKTRSMSKKSRNTSSNKKVEGSQLEKEETNSEKAISIFDESQQKEALSIEIKKFKYQAPKKVEIKLNVPQKDPLDIYLKAPIQKNRYTSI